MWDAVLMYAKVERNNAAQPIGSEAKLRKAQMAFFQHDFDWAKSQIDVLKASTGKLISNDAIEMSILIYEGAVEDDSTQRPLQLYASALLMHKQHKNDTACLYIDSLKATGQSFLIVEGLLLKAKIMAYRYLYSEAYEYYNEIIKNYGYETNVDKALYQAAVLQFNEFKDNAKAIELLTQLLKLHPSSIYCIEARSLIRKARQA